MSETTDAALATQKIQTATVMWGSNGVQPYTQAGYK